MPISKPKPAKKIIENIVKEKRKKRNNYPAVVLRVPEKELKYQDISKTQKHSYYEVSKDPNPFKSKTDFDKIDVMRKDILLDAKKRFGSSTLLQLKNNVRDSNIRYVPNSLPRTSSLMGIINAYKKQGITNFAIAVTDIKTGKVMGYTVIRLSKAAQNFVNGQFKKIDLESRSGEQSFRTFSERIMPVGENAELRYENHLKDSLGFQIKHLTMPGYTIDPKTRDFRSKTLKERLGLKK